MTPRSVWLSLAMRVRRVCVLVIAGLASCLLLTASPRAAQRMAQFSTRTETIRIDVLATRGDRPMNGLTADDFEVTDNGVPQRVRVMGQGNLPVDVVLALDISSSMQGEPLAQVLSATSAMVDSLRPDDRLALLTFSHIFDTFVGLTRDRARVRTVLARSTAGGGTSLNDAAYAALLAAEPGNRTLVMLFTDGRDSTSWLTPRAVVDVAHRLDVVAYSVTLREQSALPSPFFIPSRASRVDAGEELADLLPHETGGRVLITDRADRLRGVFQDILTEFAQRYLLAYEPTSAPKPGWHTLSVKLKAGRRGQLQARPGYFVSAR